jgi:protein kinase C substrate 80K-H
LSPHTLDTPSNTSHSLPGFYCKNKGHQPSYVPFTNVNDGICDYDLCCDGSEEWAGLVKCVDKCAEIGKEWRKHAEARQKSATNAGKKRASLIQEAQKLRQSVEDRLQTLEAEIEAAELKVKSTAQELQDVQKSEAGRAVQAGPGKGGKLGQLVELAKSRVNELRENLVVTRAELSVKNARLQQLESLLSTFKTEYNPNFNDEGVKRAVRAWEDYAASYTVGEESNAARERDLDEITKDDQEGGLNWDDYVEEEGDTDVRKSAPTKPHLLTWELIKISQSMLLPTTSLLPSASGSTASSATSDKPWWMAASLRTMVDHPERRARRSRKLASGSNRPRKRSRTRKSPRPNTAKI